MSDGTKIDWKDFIALFLAAIRTILLPIIVFAIILIILAVIFTHLS